MAASPSNATLHDLIQFALEIGSNLRLVQGAGGNISVKHDGIIWIKASGTRLADAADKPIFVPLDRAAALPAVLVTETLDPFIVAASAPGGLRPSIETALHVLLPHRYVVHVHAVGTIAAGLTDGVDAEILTHPYSFATRVVPYAKPGINLALAVNAVLAGAEDSVPVAVFLRNHGLVVGAEDLPTIRAMITEIEDRFAGQGATNPPELSSLSTTSLPEEFESLAPAGALTTDQAAILFAGPLTPDASVYLGVRPFAPESDASELQSCIIRADGSVLIRTTLGPDEREVALSMIEIAQMARTDEAIVTLSDDDVQALLNWDAEKWRQAMKR